MAGYLWKSEKYQLLRAVLEVQLPSLSFDLNRLPHLGYLLRCHFLREASHDLPIHSLSLPLDFRAPDTFPVIETAKQGTWANQWAITINSVWARAIDGCSLCSVLTGYTGKGQAFRGSSFQKWLLCKNAKHFCIYDEHLDLVFEWHPVNGFRAVCNIPISI